MEMQRTIKYDKLVQLVKQLSLEQWNKLKQDVEAANKIEDDISEMEAFLLKAPVFNETQFKEIANTRKEINQWREK